MSAEENKANARRLGDAIGRNDLDTVRSLTSQEIAEKWVQLLGWLRSAFPDLHGGYEEQIADGDWVASRWVYRGTHQGEFVGIAPTGREVVFEGVTMERWENGLVVEETTGWDPSQILAQVGAELRAVPIGEAA